MWVPQGTKQSNSLVLYQNSGSALSRTGTACELEVPLGVGNSLLHRSHWSVQQGDLELLTQLGLSARLLFLGYLAPANI